jgi:molybdenum cofactor cytidylyltransferase
MIAALILAAGQSKRMGQPKMLLPWGTVTVIEQVIRVFAEAGMDDILVITGGVHEQVQDIILNGSREYPVRTAYNKDYESGEMLSSIQCGLRDLTEESIGAALIALGDQPQVEESSVRRVCEAFLQTKSPLVVPSYRMRRGHPWLVARSLWNEILNMGPAQTPRNFLNAHAEAIHYVELDSPTILADLDTPEDYRVARP